MNQIGKCLISIEVKERLIKDNKLRQLLSENLSKESIGNEDEIVKLYEMINE